jgi:hypothetical protein
MRVEATEDLHSLLLRRPWRRLAGIAYALVLPPMLFVVVLFVSLLLNDRSLFSKLVGVGLILLALANVYFAAMMLVNVTDVELTREELSMRHGPLPCPGAVTVPRSQIAGLEVYQVARYPWNGVRAKLRDGGEVLVFSSFDPEEAEFVHAQLAARLGP